QLFRLAKLLELQPVLLHHSVVDASSESLPEWSVIDVQEVDALQERQLAFDQKPEHPTEDSLESRGVIERPSTPGFERCVQDHARSLRGVVETATQGIEANCVSVIRWINGDDKLRSNAGALQTPKRILVQLAMRVDNAEGLPLNHELVDQMA